MTTQVATTQPIKTIEDWYEATSTMASYTAATIQLRDCNNDGHFDQLIEDGTTKWIAALKRAATAENALRDAHIRRRAYAFSKMQVHGKCGDEDFFVEVMGDQFFRAEADYLYGIMSDSEIEKQEIAGTDVDLSMYLEAVSMYYCNTFLNMADGGNREEAGEDSWVWQRILELTAKLEERKMFDEFYVARSAIVHSFSGLSANFAAETEKREAWEKKANNMLFDLYSRDLVPAGGNDSTAG